MTPIRPGEAVTLMPGLRCLRADNPGPLTGPGTNTFLLGEDDLVVIDPGPDLDDHLQSILGAIARRQQVSHILVTHAHLDHSALAARLAAATGAPVLAFGDARAGRAWPAAGLPENADLGGGEGIDAGFRPDRCLADGDMIEGQGWRLEALHTPGHFGNHLCFRWQDSVFSGDLAMGWATSLVSPPDGDMGDYLASLDRLRALAPARLFPGHGAPVEPALPRIEDLIAHRRQRESQILAELAGAPATASELAERIYAGLAPPLRAAGARNVLAHLLDLWRRGVVTAAPAPGWRARFRLRQP